MITIFVDTDTELSIAYQMAEDYVCDFMSREDCSKNERCIKCLESDKGRRWIQVLKRVDRKSQLEL